MQSVHTIVWGKWVMTDPRLGSGGVLEDGAVAVGSDGRVVEVGPRGDVASRHPEARVEGGAELLIMPGLVDAHSHGSGLSYLELGVGYDHLEYWNTKLGSLDRPDPYLDFLWCGIKHLRSGCTTIHHMSNVATVEAAETATKAYERLGMRWALSVTVKDQNLMTYDDEAFAGQLRGDLATAFRESSLVPDGPRVRNSYLEVLGSVRSDLARPGYPVGHGPMGPQWCSTELLELISRDSQDTGTRVHMHAIQTPYQRESVWRSRGKSAVAYLKDLGLLGPRLTLGHGVWVEEADLDELSGSGTSLTHHASCNLNMRNGILPLVPLLARGVRVGIGIDGKGINDDEDMIQEMRVVEKLHRVADLSPGAPPGVSCAGVAAMATVNGAGILGLDDTVGTLAAGKAADLIGVDMSPRPYLDPGLSPYHILVMSRRSSDVKLVMVNGETVLRDGRVLTVDEREIADELASSVGRSRMPESAERARLMESLRPHLVDFYAGWEGAGENHRTFYIVNRRD